jgi:hypothetical protein
LGVGRQLGIFHEIYATPIMIKKISCLLFSVGIVVSALHAQSVESDYDKEIDFAKFKTYAWLAPGDSVLNRYRADKLFCGSIWHAANKELSSRGLKLDSLKPDAIMVFYTSVDEITTYSQTPSLTMGVGVAVGPGYYGGPRYYGPGYAGYGHGYGYGPGYYAGVEMPVAGGEIVATTKQEGELKFVMYDGETGKMVWNGMVTKKFKFADNVEQIIFDYTVKIFKKYPVKKSK